MCYIISPPCATCGSAVQGRSVCQGTVHYVYYKVFSCANCPSPDTVLDQQLAVLGAVHLEEEGAEEQGGRIGGRQ